MTINIIAPISDKTSSFKYVAHAVVNLLKDKKINLIDRKSNVYSFISKRELHEFTNSILIDTTLNGIVLKIKTDIWWTDEPMLIPNRPKEYLKSEGLYKYFLAVSKRYAEHVKKYLDIKVSDIVFRPYNPIAERFYCNYENKEYDIIYIGKDAFKDRKRADYIVEYLRSHPNVKGVMITDYNIPKSSTNIYAIRIGDVSEADKFNLISKSKFLVMPSEAETFGLPILEAMAVGTIPIFPDSPPFDEFATGISFKTLYEKMTYRYGCKIISYELDNNSLFETIDYALNLSKEEYDNLSIECETDAKQINEVVKDKLLNYINKIEV